MFTRTPTVFKNNKEARFAISDKNKFHIGNSNLKINYVILFNPHNVYLLSVFLLNLARLAIISMTQLRMRQVVDTLLTSTSYTTKGIARIAKFSLATLYNINLDRF